MKISNVYWEVFELMLSFCVTTFCFCKFLKFNFSMKIFILI